jgi:hypothetical protein
LSSTYDPDRLTKSHLDHELKFATDAKGKR